jgi:hypothetical protein
VAIIAQSITNTLNMNRIIGLGVAEAATDAMVAEIVGQRLRARKIRQGIATARQYRDANLAS